MQVCRSGVIGYILPIATLMYLALTSSIVARSLLESFSHKMCIPYVIIGRILDWNRSISVFVYFGCHTLLSL